MDLVLKLRELRRQAGMSQEILAAKSGVHGKTISSWETGRRIASLKVRHLEAAVVACGYTLEQFFSPAFDDEQEEGVDVASLNRAELAAITRVASIFQPFNTRRVETMLRYLAQRERVLGEISRRQEEVTRQHAQ